jgi:hypothetical protein
VACVAVLVGVSCSRIDDENATAAAAARTTTRSADVHAWIAARLAGEPAPSSG